MHTSPSRFSAMSRRSCSLLALCLSLSVPSTLGAITWHFDEEGSRQGWTAKESGGFSWRHRAPLRSEVRGGVWRIAFRPYEEGRLAKVTMISPVLGHDSALFDRVVIRLRLVHTQPVQGRVEMSWSNASLPTLSEVTPSVYHYVTYRGDWQEIEIADLRTGRDSGLAGSKPVVWENELIDIRLRILPVAGFTPGTFAPEAVEIDWIVLTGAEEHLQGELPPPQTETVTGGALFAPPVYYPLDQGGQLARPFAYGALGDLDGDQDLDLATVWDGRTTREQRKSGEWQFGWLYAFNDGAGAFRDPHLERGVVSSSFTSIEGADLNGDGRMDLMPAQGLALRILLNDAEKGWVESAAFEPAWLWSLSDADEDGDVDLWVGERVAGSQRVRLVLNDGTGHFDREVHKELEPLGEQDVFLGFRLSESGEIVREHLPVPVNRRLVRYVDDFDDDGDRDLLVSSQEWTAVIGEETAGLRVFRGLTFRFNQGDGNFDSTAWRPEADVASGEYVRWLDLNGDGLRDWVFVDGGERETALVAAWAPPTGCCPSPKAAIRWRAEAASSWMAISTGTATPIWS